MKNFITLFSGYGGFEEGAIAAGWKCVGGLDNWAEAVEAQALRGRKIEHADIRNYDFDRNPWSGVDHIHASPSCKNASRAKGYSKETQEDRDCVEGIIRALEVIQPDSFSLENVPSYEKFPCFRRLYAWLNENDYNGIFSIYNAANFGVPQNRFRLILVVKKNKLPKPIVWPRSMHLPSWYDAIKDLIPDLPDSKFTNWQLKALQGMLPDEPALVPKVGARLKNGQLNWIGMKSPSRTIKALGHDRHWQQFSLYLPATTVPKKDAQVKQVSIRCYARLQGFSDQCEFPFLNSISMQLIGNAVPPPMAQAIMESLD